MKKIISIAGEALALMKLKPMDKALTDAGFQHQAFYMGNVDNGKSLVNILGDYKNSILFKEYKNDSASNTTAKALLYFEEIFGSAPPKAILIADDTNVSFAATLSAIKKNIPVFNLEAGIRINDRRIPEEINRRAIDSITEIFFTTEKSSTENLLLEGNDKNVIFEVGSLLNEFLNNNSSSYLFQPPEEKDFIFCDFRHPSNDMDPIFYTELLSILRDLAELRKVILPLKNESKKILEQRNLLQDLPASIKIVSPASFIEYLSLIKSSDLVLTDYGNTQELSSLLNKQCITFGTTSDRKYTVEKGTNHLVGTHLHEMRNLSVAILEGYAKKPQIEHQEASTEIAKVISTLL